MKKQSFDEDDYYIMQHELAGYKVALSIAGYVLGLITSSFLIK
ncbi:unnamed protein product [Fructobacillus evanidus]|uniref:Uncharacterized protein n=1 Tax=Fructobacillus evanidus TaxID=3064281 RepID=A0ABN9Z073_9LACO|nr:unnamed protein product [Fructobacillus sp. LMG 32999]CAK1255222.1 unnamed protein product [Fructobacillus sp. LMG 32999]